MCWLSKSLQFPSCIALNVKIHLMNQFNMTRWNMQSHTHLICIYCPLSLLSWPHLKALLHFIKLESGEKDSRVIMLIMKLNLPSKLRNVAHCIAITESSYIAVCVSPICIFTVPHRCTISMNTLFPYSYYNYHLLHFLQYCYRCCLCLNVFESSTLSTPTCWFCVKPSLFLYSFQYLWMSREQYVVYCVKPPGDLSVSTALLWITQSVDFWYIWTYIIFVFGQRYYVVYGGAPAGAMSMTVRFGKG